MTTVEGNKLIAEFMGFKSHKFETEDGAGYDVELIGYPKKHSITMSCAYYGTLQFNIDMVLSWSSRFFYHSSWDWLMPVVEKIVSMGFVIETRFTLAGNDVHIIKEEERLNVVAYSRVIDAVYNTVIQFVQWYNTQKPTA